jgi:ABC-type amino acid transport substrate-binding protein
MQKLLFVCVFLAPLISFSEDYYITHGVQGLFSEVNIAIIDEVYKPLNIQPTHIFEPQQRSILVADQGKADAILFRALGAEERYPHLIPLEASHYSVKIHAFTNQPLTIESWADLSEYKIAYLAGFVVAENNTVGMNRTGTKSLEQALRLLNANRVDVVIATRESGLEIIRSWSDTNVQIQPQPLATVPLYHYVHEKHQDLILPLNNSLKLLIENNELERITQRALAR